MAPLRCPEKRAAYRKAWGLRQHGTPCRKCGACDRYPNGNCRPCGIEGQRRHRERDPVFWKKRQVTRYYGVSGDTKEALYREQQGLCAFCKEPLPDVWARGCHVEHDHATGQIRGLVHHGCNMVIGILENPRFQALAKDYFR